MSRKAAQELSPQLIVILGCGNVAWHLAAAIKKMKGYDVTICNHRPNPVLDDFRFKLKCKTYVGFENMPNKAAFYIICVADKFIQETAERVKCQDPKTILLHTSGSSSLEVLGDRIQGLGVLYPLQSFSKNDLLPWHETPILIEGSDNSTTKKIGSLAKQLSPFVRLMNSEERLHMHLCAVLVNNFTNALYVSAEEHLKGLSKASDFKLLLPLINTGVRKLNRMSAKSAQTGPAKRSDKKVMQKHVALLKKASLVKKIYKDMSKLIKEQQDART